MKTTHTIIVAAALLVGVATTQAQSSCYVGELAPQRPIIVETVVVLVDVSTDPKAVKESYLAVIKTLPDKVARKGVILTYAGHTTTEALKEEFSFLIEPPLSDAAVIENTTFKAAKALKACLAKQTMDAKNGLVVAMNKVFEKMPLETNRSEIAAALSSTIKTYSAAGQSLQVWHLSDGLQFGQRNFYGANKQARKLDPTVELKAFSKEATTAPKAKLEASYLKVLWWGMLVMPESSTKSAKSYLNTETITSFTTFWDQFLKTQGADVVTIGTPQLLNPDLSIPISHPK